MKRTLTYISGVLLLITALCISCQKEQNSLEEKGAPANEVVIRATISDAATKVFFTEDTNNKLKTAWETDDHIVGWDAKGNAIELEIASIEDNTAIFKTVEGSASIPTSGNVYMIYAPGKSMADISNSSLEYYLSNQDSGKLPALMTATGSVSVSDNVLALNFTNRLAIVAVKNPKFQVTEATPITGLQLSGDNILTTASFSEDGSGGLQMNSSVNGTITRACSFTTGTDGTSDTMVYFAVLPNSTEANVTVSTSNPTGYQISFSGKSFTAGQCYMLDQKDINKQTFTVTVANDITNGTITTSPSGNVAWGTEVTVTPAPAAGYGLDAITVKDADGGSVTVADGKFTMPAKNVTVTATFEALTGTINGHKYVKIGGKKWATTNIGATNPQNCGKYFQWGEIAGHECNGTAEYSTFKDSHIFSWAFAPFNGGKSSYDEATFNSCKSTCLSGDNLKSDYDAAFKATGWGSSWRMPTKDDFVALAANGVWYWTTNYNSIGVSGYIVYVAKNDSDKGKAYMNSTWKKWNDSNFSTTDASAATETYGLTDPHIFFPAAGCGNGSYLNNTAVGNYWSSSLYTSSPDNAYSLRFYSGNVEPQCNYNDRHFGFSVRPVSD